MPRLARCILVDDLLKNCRVDDLRSTVHNKAIARVKKKYIHNLRPENVYYKETWINWKLILCVWPGTWFDSLGLWDNVKLVKIRWGGGAFYMCRGSLQILAGVSHDHLIYLFTCLLVSWSNIIYVPLDSELDYFTNRGIELTTTWSIIGQQLSSRLDAQIQ